MARSRTSAATRPSLASKFCQMSSALSKGVPPSSSTPARPTLGPLCQSTAPNHLSPLAANASARTSLAGRPSVAKKVVQRLAALAVAFTICKSRSAPASAAPLPVIVAVVVTVSVVRYSGCWVITCRAAATPLTVTVRAWSKRSKVSLMTPCVARV